MWQIRATRGSLNGYFGFLASWAFVVALTSVRVAPAQDPWEYTPYKIQVWLALEAVPELPDGLRRDLERAIVEQSEVAFGATWDAQVGPAPARFATELLYRLDQFPVDDLVAAAKLGKSAQPKKPDEKSPGGSAPAPAKPGDAPGATATSGGALPAPSAAATPAPPTTQPPAAPPEASPAPSPPPVAEKGTGCEQATSGSEAPVAETAPSATTETPVPSAPPPAGSPAAGAADPAAAPSGTPGSSDDKAAPVDPLVAQMREVFKSDKLLVASVRATATGWRIQARELDIRSRRWTAVIELDATDPDLLSTLVVAALHQSFLPVARIDYAKEKSVMLRLRAGGLAVRPEEPVMLGEQALLRPWVRHNDRYGEPRPPMGVQAIPFSYLVVQKRDASRLECEVHTGVRFPITGRNSSRTERFALAVRPSQPTTLVRLRTNEKPPQPLSGYDIFAKDPRSEKIELIGRTDWRGTMELPPSAEFPLRVVYVKNGGSLLARLPTVPGVDPEMFVDLTPDDKRLQAEGFVSGVQAVLTDLVAQRELYAKRIRTRLSEGKLPDAEKLLEEFKALQSRDDVQKLIDQQQPRITTPHKKVQAKIDKQFEDTRKLLYKFVDPGMAGKLEDEVKQTREGKGPYAAVSGAMDQALGPSAPPAPVPPAPVPPAGAPPAPMPTPIPTPMP